MSAAAPLSEAASEMRRGRPRLYSRAELGLFSALQGTRTDRQLQEQIREGDALRTLFKGETLTAVTPNHRFAWLFDPNGRVKTSILGQLGRLPEDERIDWALLICERRMKTKDAVGMLRRARLGQKSGNVVHLTLSICRSIDVYRGRFELSTEQVLMALAPVSQSESPGDGA